ncbi:GNAT family N-acetyltransferase [Rhizobium sp. AN95]|uniref:GNAT family N-acetyltransferase n=1 Tax=Rhizobium sp. AN95 TaxID=3035216 RepID=UPI002B25C425|nr:GNAT family N-acetyltransferase [Rhizobium sp. AN95]
MSDIWVAPEFEGRGAGSLLIRALERQIADRGFAEAFIDVTAANGRALGTLSAPGIQGCVAAIRVRSDTGSNSRKNKIEEDIFSATERRVFLRVVS